MHIRTQPNMLRRTLGIEDLRQVMLVGSSLPAQPSGTPGAEGLLGNLRLLGSNKYELMTAVEERGSDRSVRGFTQWFDERQYAVSGRLFYVASRLELIAPTFSSPTSILNVQTRKSEEFGSLCDDTLARQHQVLWSQESEFDTQPTISLSATSETTRLTIIEEEYPELIYTIGVAAAQLVTPSPYVMETAQ